MTSAGTLFRVATDESVAKCRVDSRSPRSMGACVISMAMQQRNRGRMAKPAWGDEASGALQDVPVCIYLANAPVEEKGVVVFAVNGARRGFTCPGGSCNEATGNGLAAVDDGPEAGRREGLGVDV